MFCLKPSGLWRRRSAGLSQRNRSISPEDFNAKSQGHKSPNDHSRTLCYLEYVQSSQTYTLKREGTPHKTRSIVLPPPKKAAVSECSFDNMSQRANTETTVMHRILSFPL